MRVFRWFLFIAPVLGGGLLAQAAPDAGAQNPLSKAEELYRRTDYRASLALLRDSGPATGRAGYIAGRDYYMLGDYKRAAGEFERAFKMEPQNSELALWLGRSFGRRAETSGPFSSARCASKARAYFEKAVALDPQNQQALDDLFDYYLEAPGFLGGGYGKAEGIAGSVGKQNPAEGRLAEARLADRRKQFDTTEEHLRRAVDLAPLQVKRLLDLARYLARQGQTAGSEAIFDKAERLAPKSPDITFARAQTYIEQKRDLERARALLNQYLQSHPAPGGPSRRQAQKLLKEASGA
jgi:tetratricopeptide (TPR) repeat protein